jgi:hypothetical protein
MTAAILDFPLRPQPATSGVEITLFDSLSGPLSKAISINPDGTLRKDGAVQLFSGIATRMPVADAAGLAKIIDRMTSMQAISSGAMRAGLSDREQVCDRAALTQPYPLPRIARTKENFVYALDRPGVVLLDFDTGGAPDSIRGLDFLAAVTRLVPALAVVGLVTRASTSAGIRRRADNALVGNSSGMHVYLFVSDVADSDRFLRTLHDRAWLAGLGWYTPARDGKLLERSIVDQMVASSERLIFEGKPILSDDLVQEPRTCSVHAGGYLDTQLFCPDLPPAERERVEAFKAAARAGITGRAEAAREKFFTERGFTPAERQSYIKDQDTAWLPQHFELSFDNGETVTVAQVNDDLESYVGRSLADPAEGISYGRGKAKVLRTETGVKIKSFAHGGRWYEIRDMWKGVPTAPSPAGALVSVITQRAQGLQEATIIEHVAPLPLVFFDDFGNEPAKSWLIKGVLAEDEDSSWYGAPGATKSMLLTDIAVHIASGQDWRGHKAKKRCGIIYFALERAALTKRRFRAYAIRDEKLKGLPIAVADQLIDLVHPDSVEIILGTIRAAESRFGLPVGLIIIDSWAKSVAAGGADEDKAFHNNLIAANLKRIHERVGHPIHIASVGHTGKDAERGERGSNAKEGHVDLAVIITGDTVRTAIITKGNDVPEAELTSYGVQEIAIATDEDGEPVTVGIVGAETVVRTPAATKLTPRQDLALNALERAFRGHGCVPPAGADIPVGFKVVPLDAWREELFKGGVLDPKAANPRQDFKRLKEPLLEKKEIFERDGFIWTSDGKILPSFPNGAASS